MSTARKITVVLTDTQYLAIASAVAAWGNELDADGDTAQQRGELRALNAGWERVRAAWHDKRRGAAANHD